MIVTQPWIPKTLDVVFDAGNPIVLLGTQLYMPAYPVAVQNVMVTGDAADPLVGAGGATALSVGVRTAILGGGGTSNDPDCFLRSQPIGGLSQGRVWGGGLNYVDPTQGEVELNPEDGYFGFRAIFVFSDAGTLTGTLHARWEERRINW